MVIDECVRRATDDAQHFDVDGAMAARGSVHTGLLDELLRDPYFAKAGPKSTGREQFGAAYVRGVRRRARELGLDDDGVVATVTALTATTIAAHVPAECARVIVSGGGVHNRTLMRMIRSRIEAAGRGAAVDSSAVHGVQPDAKEAMAFAVLACRALEGRINHLPQCTGSRTAAVLGKVAPGSNYVTLMSRIWGPNDA